MFFFGQFWTVGNFVRSQSKAKKLASSEKKFDYLKRKNLLEIKQ